MIPTTAELRDLALAFVSEPVSRGEEISVPVFVDSLSVRWEDLSPADRMRVRNALTMMARAYAADHEIDDVPALTDSYVLTCDDCLRESEAVPHARTFASAMAWAQLRGWTVRNDAACCERCTERRAGIIRKAVKAAGRTHQVVARLGHWECDCEGYRYRIGPNRTCDHIESVKASKKEVA